MAKEAKFVGENHPCPTFACRIVQSLPDAFWSMDDGISVRKQRSLAGSRFSMAGSDRPYRRTVVRSIVLVSPQGKDFKLMRSGQDRPLTVTLSQFCGGGSGTAAPSARASE